MPKGRTGLENSKLGTFFQFKIGCSLYTVHVCIHTYVHYVCITSITNLQLLQWFYVFILIWSPMRPIAILNQKEVFRLKVWDFSEAPDLERQQAIHTGCTVSKYIHTSGF